MVEACSGIRRDIGAVTWYVVPGASSFPESARGDVNGYYSRPGNQVVLAEHAQLDGPVVRHEMLHALLRTEAGHPRTQYLGHCAGVVRCEVACVLDAERALAPPPDARVVAPSTLTVRADLAPSAPSASRDDGWFTLTVTATNPAPTPVVVQTTPVGLSRSFSYEVAPDPASTVLPSGPEVVTLAHDEKVWDASTAHFAGGEAKRFVFDFRVVMRGAKAEELQPGRFTFRGAFGGRDVGAWSPGTTAVLSP